MSGLGTIRCMALRAPFAWFRRHPVLWLVGAAVLLVGLGAGCSTLGYYAQSIQGHMAMMEAARPIPDVIDDPNAAAPLKQRLERVQQIRAYASSDLGLPDNGSYTRYADLKRPYVVWNVFAAPELSLQLKQWCYPVVGCAGYRGYFDKAAADAMAAELRATASRSTSPGCPPIQRWDGSRIRCSTPSSAATRVRWPDWSSTNWRIRWCSSAATRPSTSPSRRRWSVRA